MREILFRGQTRRKGEYLVNMRGDKCDSNWVYGGIFPQNNGGDFAVIYQQEPTIEKRTVYADTVGQYTGLTDKNGAKVFENDIIECKNEKHHFQSQIEWDSKSGGFMFQDTSTSWCGLDALGNGGIYSDFHVIGNIFDNLELIEKAVNS